MPLPWPFGARAEQVGIVESWIADPDVRGGVVSGAAGVGKSRVVAEASTGPDTRWVVGTSSARGIPLGAFAAWAGAEATETVHLVGRVIESLVAGSPDGRLCLVVDDAHLLDDLSVFVVHQLVQRRTATVILTVREGEPIPATLREVIVAGTFDRLDLLPLTLEETTRLLTAALPGGIEPVSAQRLWTLSGGNPLYLRNVVERESRDGRIVQAGGVWRWSGDPVLPPGLIGLIESRMGELPLPVAEVVDVLAVAEPLELATLQRITDPASVEEAEGRNLIVLDSAADMVHVRVAHPLYAEVRRRKAPTTRLRRLRGAVVAELAAADSGDVRVLLKRATLSVESDLPADTDLLVRAAHGAVGLADLPLAERLASVAEAAGAGPEPSFVRAHALSWLGRGEEADAVLNAVATGQLADVDRARLAFLRASNTLWALGNPQRADEIIEEASGLTSAPARAYLDAFRTVHAFATDQPDEVRRAANALSLNDLPAIVGAEVAWALTVVWGDAGRTSDALNNADVGYRSAARRFDAPQMQFNIADARLSALWLAGRLPESAELADAIRRQAADLPAEAQLLGAAVAGRAALCGGQIDTAARLLEHAVAGLSAAGHSLGWAYRYQVPQATALAMSGAASEAAAVLAALDQSRRPFRQLDYERSLARAWLAAAQGAVSEATGGLLAAARRAGARGDFAAEVLLLQTATQFGDRSCAERLAELATLVEGPRAGLAARFAQAAHDFAGTALAAASADFEQLGDLIAALDAAALAALAYRRHDQRGSALGCSTRATALAQRCGVVTPALRQASTALPLTDRETEIAMLIGQGLSTRAVAERLTLSSRTVESHVYRAMAKTGVSTREELAALLAQRKS